MSYLYQSCLLDLFQPRKYKQCAMDSWKKVLSRTLKQVLCHCTSNWSCKGHIQGKNLLSEGQNEDMEEGGAEPGHCVT